MADFIFREMWYPYQNAFNSLLKLSWQWAAEKALLKSLATDYETKPYLTEVEDGGKGSESSSVEKGAVHEVALDTWYVTSADLELFMMHAVGDGVNEPPGAGKWEVMLDKNIKDTVKYTAMRRSLPEGRTEYKSVTVCPNVTAEEFSDFYLDDDYRPKWDGMVVHHEIIESGDPDQRQQVVRWVRKFPFSFISDREYTIARRMFRREDGIYTFTKVVEHNAAPGRSGITPIDVFYSAWRSRTVPCPWGSGQPACETLLLHQEQFKIPENLARFAVRHGMWGFVKGIMANLPEYIRRRRERLAPYEVDDAAYGARAAKPHRDSPMRSTLSSPDLTHMERSTRESLGRWAASNPDLSMYAAMNQEAAEEQDQRKLQYKSSRKAVRWEEPKALPPPPPMTWRRVVVNVVLAVGLVAVMKSPRVGVEGGRRNYRNARPLPRERRGGRVTSAVPARET